MPPIYVKPYVKRSKNDAADAAAICEAVTRPTIRSSLGMCGSAQWSGCLRIFSRIIHA
jgi:transposase